MLFPENNLPVRQVSWLRPVNWALGAISRVRHQSLDASFAALEKRAALNTHLTGQGDEEFLEASRLLHDCLLTAPGLTPIGRISARADLGRRLKNRFRTRATLKAIPEIASSPITRPVFIAGLPRTGTTLLHEILGSLPGHRAPLLWEILEPSLPPSSDAERRRRIRHSRWLPAVAQRLSPALQVIHPLDAERPEECCFLLPHNLVFYARARIPGYREWVRHRDATEDYVFLKQQLQLLQWQLPPRRWILKSPFHLWSLDALFRVFPDAIVVWPHRAPDIVLASWCSLVETTMGLANRTVDLEQLGRDWLEIWVEAVSRAMPLRRQYPERFVDLAYSNLNANSDRAVQTVMSAIGAAPGETGNAVIGSPLHRSRPDMHRYFLSRYGLMSNDVREAFREYRTAFEPWL